MSITERAWRPVFSAMKAEIPGYVYEAFYPKGWESRQLKDIAGLFDEKQTDVFVARIRERVVGFVALQEHLEDSMGEVYVIAVDPEHQKRGIGAKLLEFSFSWMRDRGLAIAMVETGGDSGHAASRAAYERVGFERLPVARYFRPL